MNSENNQINPIEQVKKHLINEFNHSREDVNWLMECIEAPDSAKGLWAVATRIRRSILPILYSANDPIIRRFSERAMPICRSIEGSIESFADIPGFRFEAAKNKGRLRPGFLSDHPLFGTLWVGCDVPGSSAQYDCLRAHFTAGYLQVRPEVMTRPYILRSAALYCRSIGAIRTGEEKDDLTFDPIKSCFSMILTQLPRVWIGRSKFGDMLEKLSAEAERLGAGEDEVNALDFVADIIRGRLPERRQRGHTQRGSGSEGANRPALIGKGEPLSIPRQAAPGEEFYVIDHVGCESDDDPDNCCPGIDDEDIQPVEREVKIHPRKSSLTMDGDRLMHIGASNMADALAAANQMFPFSRAQSTGDDILHLFSSLNRIESVVENNEQLECMALAEVMLATGQSIEQCHASRLMKAGPHHDIWFDPNGPEFGFIPWSPKGHDSPVKPLVLPMPARLQKALSLLVQVSGIELGERLFSAEIETLKTRLRNALKVISEKSGATLSISSIGANLYRTIVQQNGGDESPAILITGQPTHRGYLPATYTKWSADRLIRVYMSATETLYNAEFDATPLSTIGVSNCGSSFAPTMSTIQSSVKSLGDQLRATQHLPPRQTGTIETHFTYAIYVHCMLSFATGWRPNVLPLPDWRLVDLTTGMCTVSDKDGDDAYHTHLVWLPDVAIEQLQLWEEHLQLLAERLVIINLDSANALLWRDPIKLSGNRQRDKKSWLEDPRFLFGLQIDGSRHPMLPMQIEEFIKENLGGKVNGHRHFMRTELTRLGVPDEIIRALLGHWRNGEESFGKFAAMDPLVYRKELERVMPKMLKEMGWTAVKSPFWKQ